MVRRDDALCSLCGWTLSPSWRGTPLGFRKFTCHSCGVDCTYPMGPVAQMVHTALVAVGMLGGTVALVGSEIPLPGLIAAVSAFALIKNVIVRKRAEELKRRLRSP